MNSRKMTILLKLMLDFEQYKTKDQMQLWVMNDIKKLHHKNIFDHPPMQ